MKGEIERSEMALWNSARFRDMLQAAEGQAARYVPHDRSHLASLDLPSSGRASRVHLPPQGGKGLIRWQAAIPRLVSRHERDTRLLFAPLYRRGGHARSGRRRGLGDAGRDRREADV